MSKRLPTYPLPQDTIHREMGGRLSKEKPTDKDQNAFVCSVAMLLSAKSRSEMEKTYTLLATRASILRVYGYSSVVAPTLSCVNAMVTAKAPLAALKSAFEGAIDAGRARACSAPKSDSCAVPPSDSFRHACETIALALEVGRWGFPPSDLSDIKYIAFALVVKQETQFNNYELKRIIHAFTQQPWRITVDDAYLLDASERVKRMIDEANTEGMLIDLEKAQEMQCEAEENMFKDREVLVIEELSKRPEGLWARHTPDTLRKILTSMPGVNVPETATRAEMVAALHKTKCSCRLVEFTMDEIASRSFPLEIGGCLGGQPQNSLFLVLKPSGFGDGIKNYYRSALLKFITDVQIPTMPLSSRVIKEICSKKRSQDFADLKKFIIARTGVANRSDWVPTRFETFKNQSIIFLASFPGDREAVIENVLSPDDVQRTIVVPAEAVEGESEWSSPAVRPPSPTEEVVVTSESAQEVAVVPTESGEDGVVLVPTDGDEPREVKVPVRRMRSPGRGGRGSRRRSASPRPRRVASARGVGRGGEGRSPARRARSAPRFADRGPFPRAGPFKGAAGGRGGRGGRGSPRRSRGGRGGGGRGAPAMAPRETD